MKELIEELPHKWANSQIVKCKQDKKKRVMRLRSGKQGTGKILFETTFNPTSPESWEQAIEKINEMAKAKNVRIYLYEDKEEIPF